MVIATLPRLESVKADDFLIFRQNLANRRHHLRVHRPIKEHTNALLEQPNRRISDIARNRDAKDSINNAPAAEMHNPQRKQHRAVAQEVGLVMQAVGFDDEIIGFLRDNAQIAHERKGDEQANHHHDNGFADVFELFAQIDFFHRLVENEKRRDENHTALNHAGERLDFALAIVECLAWRQPRRMDGKVVEQRHAQIKQRINRRGENGDRAA